MLRNYSDSNQPKVQARMGLLTTLGRLALCAMGWFVSIGFTMIALKTIDSDIPFFPGIHCMGVVGLAVTLPPATSVTVIALFLVGPRRARLSGCRSVFALPVVLGIGIGLWEHFSKRL